MKILGIFIGVILLLIVLFFVTAGVWYIVLWSFNFPIAFAWKQTIGIFALMLLFNGSNAASKD